MIKVKYEKPLIIGDKVTFYVNNMILTATICSSCIFSPVGYCLYFDQNHPQAIDILTDYFKDLLYDVFKQITPLIYKAAWPYSTRESLEKILDNFSIFEEF